MNVPFIWYVMSSQQMLSFYTVRPFYFLLDTPSYNNFNYDNISDISETLPKTVAERKVCLSDTEYYGLVTTFIVSDTILRKKKPIYSMYSFFSVTGLDRHYCHICGRNLLQKSASVFKQTVWSYKLSSWVNPNSKSKKFAKSWRKTKSKFETQEPYEQVLFKIQSNLEQSKHFWKFSAGKDHFTYLNLQWKLLIPGLVMLPKSWIQANLFAQILPCLNAAIKSSQHSKIKLFLVLRARLIQ